jgi:hypothetical protein
MTPPTITVDDRLDREIRATLHRHAGDVEPRPPEWDELIERADSVIVSPRRGDGIETGRGDDRRR